MSAAILRRAPNMSAVATICTTWRTSSGRLPADVQTVPSDFRTAKVASVPDCDSNDVAACPHFLRGSCWPRPCSVALPAACLLTGAYHQGFPRLNKASATASVAFAWCLNTLTDVMSFRGLPQFSAARSVCRGAI